MAKNVEDDATTNTIDPDRLKKIIADIESKIEAKLSHKMEYVESCKAYNEAISNAYEMGAAFVPKKILKAKIKERELRRKIEDIPEDFEEDDRDLFDQVTQALGGYADTPLGMATVQAAAKASAKPKGGRKAPSAQAEPGTEAGADSEAFKAGYAARQAGADDAIPAEVEGDDRDRWHNGWLAADRDMAKGAENAERLKGGIKGLPGADAPGKHTVQ